MDERPLKAFADKMMNERNHRGIADFEWYSPFEMHHILYDPLGEHSPIELRRVTDAEYENIPILNQIKLAAKIISRSGELKLTPKGNFPLKIVEEIYEKGLVKRDFVEGSGFKIRSEEDVFSINLTRILMEIAKLTKKRHGKLSLTKSGEKKLSDNHELLRMILLDFMQKFNWAYHDAFPNESIGRIGCGFSLLLLSKYGAEKRESLFYAEKYFSAFPKLMPVKDNFFGAEDRRAFRCYAIRTFEHFMEYFGFIAMSRRGKFPFDDMYIVKSDVFNALIHCKPPGAQ